MVILFVLKKLICKCSGQGIVKNLTLHNVNALFWLLSTDFTLNGHSRNSMAVTILKIIIIIIIRSSSSRLRRSSRLPLPFSWSRCSSCWRWSSRQLIRRSTRSSGQAGSLFPHSWPSQPWQQVLKSSKAKLLKLAFDIPLTSSPSSPPPSSWSPVVQVLLQRLHLEEKMLQNGILLPVPAMPDTFKTQQF